jgi:hypothetical protein
VQHIGAAGVEEGLTKYETDSLSTRIEGRRNVGSLPPTTLS